MTAATAPRFNPFPGLRPFLAEEDYLFFGREEQTAELLSLLRQHRFLAVVGTSGSGKSSLVRAGLLPALHGGTMAKAGSTWEVVVLRPGGDPIDNLARALLQADLYDPEDAESLPRLVATLTRSRLGLIEAVKQSDLPEKTNFLVVVDQFEELFRFRQSGVSGQEAAAAFVRLLLAASQQADQRIYVAITMRSDYLGDCSQVPGLAEAVNDGEYLIPRLSREQRRSAIEKPISVGGGSIAPRLLYNLLNDVGDDPDQLPLLQHALMRIWDCWAADHADGEPLDLRHYERVGGLQEALSLHADEAYAELADDQHRRLGCKLFQALTERGSDNRGIRRPTRFDQLCAILDARPAEVAAVIEAFRQVGRTFLMPMPEVALTAHTVIDISHESLMRVWQRLRAWVEEESQSARIYRRLADTALLHQEGKAGVYHDPDLQIALSWRERTQPNAAWAERYHTGFEVALAFLDQSGLEARAAENAREIARQRELEQARMLAEAQRQRLEQQQRSARKLRGMIAGLAVVALIAGVACVAALIANNRANRLAAEAAAQRDKARHSAQEAQREADRATAQEAIATAAREDAEVRAYTASLAAAAADLQRNDSRTLRRRLGEAPERLRGWEWTYLWNESDRRLQTTLTLPPANDGYQMDLSGDGKLVAVRPAGGNEKPVTIYDTRTGAQVATLTTYSSSLPLMTFSNDNRLLAYHHHGTPGVQIYEIRTGRALVPAPRVFRAFFGFDPAGERAVMLDEHEKVRIFKTGDWSVVAELPGSVPVGDFRRRGAVSPDGKLLAIGAMGVDPMRIYDLSSASFVREISDSAGATAVAVKFSDAGDSVTTLSADGEIVEYSTKDWKKVSETHEGRQQRGNLAVHRLDGYLLRLSFDSNGAVALFGFNRLTRSATLRGHGSAGSSIAIDPELVQIVTTHRDGTACRWDLRHPQQLPLDTRAVTFAPDGTSVHAGMTASADRPLQLGLVDTVSGEPQGFLRRFPWSVAHGSAATQLACSPDGQRVAVSTSSGWGQGHWRIYDLWSGLVEHETSDSEYGDLECIGWSADGRWLVVGGKTYNENSGFVRLYDAGTHQRLGEFGGGAGAVHAVAFTRDSQRLVTAAEDGTLRIWEIPGCRLLNTIGKSGDSAVNCVVHSPDGRLLLAGLADGTVAALNLLTGEQLFRSQVHGAAVRCLAFTPDGSRLLTASADRSLKVFDPSAWRELLTLHLEEPAAAMSFSPDGRRLALAAGALILLETEPEDGRWRLRRSVLEQRERANTLAQEVIRKTADPLQAREAVVQETAANEALRRAALGRLRRLLDSRRHDAYREGKLAESLKLQVLRQQLVLHSNQRPSDDQKQQLIAGINASRTADALQRQALAEYATARINAYGLDTEDRKLDTQKLAWEIISNPGRNPADHLVAYFGMGPVVRQRPSDAACQTTMAWAEYRAGLYADALESARRAAALAQNASGWLADCLAVSAMCQHQMGQTAAAVETLRKLDEAMQQPPASADQAAIALREEARKVLASPRDTPWNALAAWESCRTRLEQLLLDADKVAIWQARSLERNARRYVERGEYEPAKSDLERAGTLLEQQLAKEPQAGGYEARKSILELAARFDDLLPRLAQARPDDWQIQLACARHLAERGQQLLSEQEPEKAVAELQKALQIFLRLRQRLQWIVPALMEWQSTAGETLSVESDGSIFVTGPTPERAVYTLKLRPNLPVLTAIRLETIPDARLPDGGAGRFGSGNFHLAELTAAIDSGDADGQDTPVVISTVLADYQNTENESPRNSIDGNPRTYWDTYPKMREAHWAVFEMKSPVRVESRSVTITLDSGLTSWGQHGLGHFRLSVTGDADVISQAQLGQDLKEGEIADLNVAIAKAHAGQGRTSEAVGAFTKALGVAPDRAAKARIIREAAPLAGVLEKLAESVTNDGQSQIELARQLSARGNPSLAEALRTRSRALIEDKLAEEPDNSASAVDLADVLLPPGDGWTVLKPVEMNAASGVKLELQSDGSVFVQKQQTANNDTYTLVFQSELKRIRGLRLETLADSRLPGGGPGWAPNGNFVLNELTLHAASTGNPQGVQSIALRNAAADFSQVDWPVRGAVDGNGGTGWAVLPQLNKDHSAVFELAEPVGDELGAQLTVRLDQRFWGADHLLGRFRLSVCADSATLDRERNRFAAMKITDPWGRLAAACHLIGDRSALARLIKHHPAAQSGIGHLYADDQDWVRAIAEYSKAITPQTRDAELFVTRAEAFEKREQWEEAIADWGRVDELVFDKNQRYGGYPGLIRRAQLYERLRQFDKAQADYDRAVASPRLGLEPLIWRVGHWARRGRWKEAAEDYRQVWNRRDQSWYVEWYFSRERALLNLLAGDLEGYRQGAAELVTRTEKSSDGDSSRWLAYVLIAGPNAITDANRDRLTAAAERIDPWWNPRLKGALLFRRGEFQQAADLLDQNGGGPAFEFVAAMAHHQLQHIDRARQLFAQASAWIHEQRDSDPGCGGGVPRNHYWAEWCIILQLQREAARKLYGQRLVELDARLEAEPASASLLLERAQMLETIGLYDEALGDLNRVAPPATDSAEFLGLRGRILAGLNMADEALAELNRAAQGHSADPLDYVARARIYRDRGETGPARAALEESLKIRPSGQAAEMLADLLLTFVHAQTKLMVPTSEIEAVSWRYTTAQPPAGWVDETFDDSAWTTGAGPFGKDSLPKVRFRTQWTTSDIWLRRTFEWTPDPAVKSLLLRALHDDGFELFLNGKQIYRRQDYTGGYVVYCLDPGALGVLKSGTNTLAVHCQSIGGGQHIDAGLHGVASSPQVSQQRFAAMKIADPWAKLAAAYVLVGDTDRAVDLLARSGDKNATSSQKLEDSLAWLRIAPLVVLADDRAYSEFCGRMAQQFAETELPEVAERVVKACLLRPKSIDLVKLPGDTLARSLDEATAPEWLLPWGWASRALSACRSGDAESASKYVTKSEEHQPAEFAHALNLAVRAMVLHQLQHSAESRRVLDEAAQLIDRLQVDENNKLNHDFLIFQILFREAAALINGQSGP
jgi:WD40 repeat protein